MCVGNQRSRNNFIVSRSGLVMPNYSMTSGSEAIKIENRNNGNTFVWRQQGKYFSLGATGYNKEYNLMFNMSVNIWLAQKVEVITLPNIT